MKLRITFFIYFFLQFVLSGFAQKDTITVDSARIDTSAVADTKFQDLIKKSNEMRRKDSLQKMELQSQIALLRESNDLKKEKLQIELRQLVSKDSLRKVADRLKIDSLKRTIHGYPVVPFTDTVFTIYVKSGSSKPAERAANVARKIQTLYKDEFLKLDSISIEESESTVDIVYGTLLLRVFRIWMLSGKIVLN